MIELLTEIWGVIAALWNTGVRSARVAIRVVFGLIVTWPFVLLGVSLTGSAGFTAGVALVPLAAVFLLALVYPLVSGVLVAFPIGRTFYIWLGVVLFAELIIGLYLAAIPVWNRPELIPVLALLVVILGMFLILKRQFGFRQGGWLTKTLALAILVVTVAFFFNGGKKTAEVAVQTVEAEKPVPAPSPGNIREVALVLLQGEGVVSEETITIPGTVPPLWYYYFDGPPSTKVHFNSGGSFPITELRGQRGGSLRFSGPKGGKVFVKAYPPP